MAGFAETAQLAVNLTLGGNFSSGVTAAESKLGALNVAATKGVGTTGVLSSAFSKLSTVATGVGGALSHAGTQLKGLLTGPLGFLGLTGGLLSIGAAIGSSIGKIEAFGQSLEQIQTLTGESTLATGALIIQFQKFGLGADRIAQVVGFAEKTLGKLNETASAAGSGVSKLAALDAQYGLQLLDSTGKVVDFSTTLEQLAAFYDSSASASTKAYVASQVLGRGYTTMIPILNEGAAGIRAAAEEAKGLGLDSAASADQILKFHDMMHNLGEQVNLLQLKIGMALIPIMSDLVSTISTWLSSGGATQIADFFRKGADFAEQMGHAISTYVVPVFGAIADAWGSIPGPLKDLLIGGFVAQKGASWLFGSGPLQWIKSLVGMGASKIPGVGGILGGIGVQHVWVDNLGAGGLPGGLGPQLETTLATLAPETIGAFVAGLATITAGALTPFIMFNLIPKLFPGNPNSTGTSQINTTSAVGQPALNLVPNAWSMVNSQLGPNGQIAPAAGTPLGPPKPSTPLSLANLVANLPGGAALLGAIGTGTADLGVWTAAQTSHAANRTAFSARTFRSGAAGGISEFPDLIRYLAGAQGAYGGTGNAGFLSSVRGTLATLQREMKGATPEQSAKIAGEITVLQQILRDKRFEPSAALLTALKATPDAKKATDNVAQDVRESTRLNNQAQLKTKSAIDFAKVENTRATDAATAAINASRDAIVRAILGKTQVVVQVTAAAVTKAQATVAAHQNPTTMNNRGMVAS